MKILISVYCIKEIGGISTSVTNLLKEIHNLYDVSLCVPSNFISPRYEIPNNVNIIRGSNILRDATVDVMYLSNQNLLQKLKRTAIRIIKRTLPRFTLVNYAIDRLTVPGEYDVAIAFSDEGFDRKYRVGGEDYRLVLGNVKAQRKIAWIHNDPRKLGWTPELCKKELSGFDAIVNVSQECKNIFDEIMPSYKRKSWLVYNMYDIDRINRLAKEEIVYNSNKIHLVTVARINCNQKRIDRIVDICKKLKQNNITNFDWIVVGDGSDKQLLENRANEYGLSDLLLFVGHKKNPYPYMSQADAFVLASEYEGYGMTIKEAQILGTPTIVTNFGPAHEAVIDGKQGVVCENSTDALYETIRSILANPKSLKEFQSYLLENPVDNRLAITQFNNLCYNIEN